MKLNDAFLSIDSIRDNIVSRSLYLVNKVCVKDIKFISLHKLWRRVVVVISESDYICSTRIQCAHS